MSAIRDCTERKRFERALLEKNIELESASRAKDRLLATINSVHLSRQASVYNPPSSYAG